MLANHSSSASPIRLGYCLSLSGPVGGNGQAARLAHEIWTDDINKRGGLLGRPVEIVCYDDGSDAVKVPALYRKLLDEDEVDLVFGGYGTNTILPAMPLIMERQRFFVGLMGLGVNNELNYPNYFAMVPTGPDPNAALTEGFFELGAVQNPRPTTVGLISADAEFARNPIRGAKANALKHGYRVVHEATYPLTTTDFEPLIEAVAQSQCDLLFLCSYLDDSIGLVRAIRAHTFRPKMVGASMIGPQNAMVKAELGPLLNGFVNYEYWVPVPALKFNGVQELLARYRTRAVDAGVDPLGHYMAPLAYAQMQVIAQAIEATGSLNDADLSAYAREARFQTVMGDVMFGNHGEWVEPRVVQVQFQEIVGHDATQFLDASRQVVVSPVELVSGRLIYPYELAI
ncbi:MULTISPECIES: amino acid ABC transporter substrate-binding protein [unclassified Roseateles]|uniref:amino acid ABC transporter substrate-binding protein n=1 Tax=unclassified Roseateles TaxID=2626991 RepID=UPI0006F2EAD3|nr:MULTISPECIES: amino acid ABC transporter substrate-binding protein [unclassified Roseateles]KQW49562.1 branched-chain amino acid ABC transporter substrate-binding protein [Pelomonas sp. Root405]KRA75619.1 branched-chain amino acid ABC transporter substrate-binding protein [Pelomonas sp. Root662]